MMARSCRQLAIAHPSQFPAQCLPRDADPEFLPDPLAQIHNSPTHDTMHRRDRPVLDHRRQRRAMRVVQAGRLARRLAINQTVRSARIELHHPVADDLQRHAADPPRLGAGRPVVDRRKRRKTTRLRRYGDGARKLVGEYGDAAHLLVPNRDYRIEIAVYDGCTRVRVDGADWFTYRDPHPLTAGYLGLRTTWSRQTVDDLTIQRLE